jgi:hypothetical protein
VEETTGRLGLDVRTIFKCILEKWDVRCGLDSASSVQGPVAGSCEHNQPLASMKWCNILTIQVTVSFPRKTCTV